MTEVMTCAILQVSGYPSEQLYNKNNNNGDDDDDDDDDDIAVLLYVI